MTSSRALPARDGKPRRPSNSSQISSELRTLCIRLAPLRQVEEMLISLLSGRLVTARRHPPPVIDDDQSSLYSVADSQKEAQKLPQEIAFPSNGGWKVNFQTLLAQRASEDSSVANARRAHNRDVPRILSALANDMTTLWADQSVQKLLKSSEIRLDEQPGLYSASLVCRRHITHYSPYS